MIYESLNPNMFFIAPTLDQPKIDIWTNFDNFIGTVTMRFREMIKIAGYEPNLMTLFSKFIT